MFASRDILSFYHDLGVLAFAGSSVNQVDRIADLIQQAVDLTGTMQRSISAVCHFNRLYTKYRLPTEDWHIDAHYKPKEGILSTEALLDLGKKAVFKWAGEALEKLEDDELKMKTITVREDAVHIQQGPYARGIIHQTVNGPRRLPVDAFVSIQKANEGCLFSAEFFAVGTSHYLGRVFMRAVFFSISDVKEPLSAELVSRLLSTVRRPYVRTIPPTPRSLNDSLRILEEEIWFDRVPEAFLREVEREEEVNGLPRTWDFSLGRKSGRAQGNSKFRVLRTIDDVG
ncbi:hypothetical protein AK830_g11129 [Neonectria ditissima]|uniref:Uncharacterized protein n=1 Tax=Neonectria ditissima TaxID=78410 RepID=A0A0P7B3Y7_9HYPO|nr:hypothetical protein AK830_g11129 [Neonectria ditissima]